MSNPEIGVEDAELLALMAELEEASADFVAATPAPATAPAPAPIPEPEPVEEPKPVEPEPVPVKAPPAVEPVAEKATKPKAVKVVKEEIDMAAPETTDEEIAPSADRPGAKLKFGIDVTEFNKETRLTEATLDSAMIEQSALRAYYGVQAAQAEGQAARIKVRFEVIEAQLYDSYRKAMAASGEKVTEKAVENAVKLDATWVKAMNTKIEADTIAAINKSLVFSLADRRDMIMQIGFDRRDEMKGAARILAAQGEREDLAQRAANAAKGALTSKTTH